MEYFGILVILAVFGLGYWAYSSSNETPVVSKSTPRKPRTVKKTTKISKANLNKLTKVQLEEKGRELGIEVDKRLLKSKIINDVYKAQ
tara:strand:- start:73 stop:336 length:264 start_codon:yes stop_codon:yes gene_type:complete